MSSAAGFTPLPASECRAPGAGGGGTPGMRILGRARLGRLPRRSPGFSGKGLALSCGCSAPVQPRCSRPDPAQTPPGARGDTRLSRVSCPRRTRATPPPGPREAAGAGTAPVRILLPSPRKKSHDVAWGSGKECHGQRQSGGATGRARHGWGVERRRGPPRVQHPKSPRCDGKGAARGAAVTCRPLPIPLLCPSVLSMPAGRARPQLITPATAPASTPSLLYPTWSLDTDFFFRGWLTDCN